MCGITGIVTKNGTPPSEVLLRSMASRIAHRGPDGEGIWVAPGVGLVHRRLAIIDLSPRGAQPMHDSTGKLTITFNGEIYNYKELKEELSVVGAVPLARPPTDWQSDSDTEVILEGYRVWGDEVVKKLRGMFAFALWDAERQRLLVARDRIGKKPFFYATTVEGDFVFASELKALHGVVPQEVDREAIRLFLGLQYVPSPRTGFKNIAQLLPGYLGIWEKGSFRTEKYHEWNVGAGFPRPPMGSEEGRGNLAPTGMVENNIDQNIRTKLEEAVKIRQLAADVPVGAFLSGGIDSAAVVAYASRYVTRPLQTFTMGFPQAHMDERNEAAQIARHFSTEHHAFEARPEHLIELLDTLVTHYDAPYADSSALPLWLLSRETAKHIKVVLTGDGGDEVFGGYRRYVAFSRALQFGAFPGAASLVSMSGRILERLLHDPRFGRMADTMQTLRERPERAYGEMFCGSYFGTDALHEMCTPEFLRETRDADAVDFVTAEMRMGVTAVRPIKGQRQLDVSSDGRTSRAPLRSAMFFDLTSYLPDDLNVKMDRATMAFGLEARAPFLDQELIAYSFGLPMDQLVSHGKTKIALKRALRGVVPNEVLDRPKRGFQVPLAEWFRGPLLPVLRERCLGTSSPLSAFMQEPAIFKLIEENSHGHDHGNRLWMLLGLATWLTSR